MDPAKFRWISCDDTHLLMRFDTIGCRGEWAPVARVVLRQVYQTHQPMYYACVPAGDDDDSVGQSTDLEEAKNLAQIYIGA